MAISRMQMNRQLRARGGIMDLTHREKFGLGSKLKRAVRKIIPNEVSEVAVKAAPFVAPFNPMLAGAMAGIGGFDQTGSIGSSLKRGLLTYGGGQAARYLGGAGFQQAGLSNLGLSGFSSPIGTQTGIGKMLADRGFVETQTFTPSGDVGLASEGSIVGASPVDPSKAYLPSDFATEALPLERATASLTNAGGEVAKRTFTDISKDLFSGDFTKMGNAAKELGGKALKAIYTDKDGKLDKMALAGTIAAGTSYLEAAKLAEDAGLVDDADDYTEDMYESDKAKYAERFDELLPASAFGLKDGGRVNFLEGGDTEYNAMVTRMYIEAGGEEATGMTIDEFADEYFKKFAKGGRVDRKMGSPEDGEEGIMSIKLETGDDKEEEEDIMMMADAPGITFSSAEKSYLFRRLGGAGGSSRSYTMPQLYGILNNPNSPSNIDDAKVLKEIAIIGLGESGKKDGGRVQYAMGSPEENAVKASGISGIPLNVNPAGATELDMRKTGGFVPPVGVKEKADDIPAMLSNNEFVFTADAVRAAGGGSVNKGAQKMYKLMKSLENKVV